MIETGKRERRRRKEARQRQTDSPQLPFPEDPAIQTRRWRRKKEKGEEKNLASLASDWASATNRLQVAVCPPALCASARHVLSCAASYASVGASASSSDVLRRREERPGKGIPCHKSENEKTHTGN